MLREERDDSGADACQLYWVIRSGFDILPYNYDIPKSDLANYPSATEPEAEEHMFQELMRAKDAGYLDTWDVIRRECNCEHLESPHFVHPLGMLSKLDPDGKKKFRALIDASRSESGKENSVNARCEKADTKYCTIEMIMMAMHPHGAYYRADFEDCFMQIPFSLWSRRFSGIRFRGVLYAFRRGSYGYRNLPSLAQTLVVSIIRAATRRMLQAGLKCGVPPSFDHHCTFNRPASRGHQHTGMYGILDDVCGVATTHKAATFGFLMYCWLTFSLGYKLSKKPGKTVPPSTDEMVFIGYLLSLKKMTASLEPARIAKLIATMDAIILRNELTLHELQSLLGVLVFCCTILGMRTYYRSFIIMIKAFNKTSRRTLRLTADFKHDIRQWHKLVHLFNGRTVYIGVRRKRCSFQAYSDASFLGWGWAWAGRTEVGSWPKAWMSRFGQLSKKAQREREQQLLTGKEKPDDERIWIAFCEAVAALACLRRILPYIEPGTTLKFNEDNQNVCSWLSKLNCPSEMSKGVIAEIAWLLACYSVQLDVAYITSKANKVADLCSRWASASQLEKKSVMAAYTRLQPHNWNAIGIVRRQAFRPELFEVMDVWQPEKTNNDFSWMPPPLTR